LAPIIAVPAPWQFACPATLGALAMVATGPDEELQWLFSVISCVLLSLKVPIAAKSCALPTEQVAVAGVTASETSVPLPTVNVVVPVTPEAEAEIVTDPFFLP
jgi:hypothetical protein